jgi:acyl-CoA thioesterase-1
MRFLQHRVGIVIATLALAFAAALPARAEGPFRLVALGDSLTAGYRLPPDAAFPAVLRRELARRGIAAEIENAGVSGDTATGGRDRLDWSVPDGTEGVIVELGANDALRGVPPAVTEAALDAILVRLKERGIKALLAGMRAPPNNGPEFVAAFDGMFARLAARHDVPLYPFFLDGVAGNPALNLDDGIHPTRAGVEEIVRRMLPSVEAFLKTLRPGR